MFSRREFCEIRKRSGSSLLIDNFKNNTHKKVKEMISIRWHAKFPTEVASFFDILEKFLVSWECLKVLLRTLAFGSDWPISPPKVPLPERHSIWQNYYIYNGMKTRIRRVKSYLTNLQRFDTRYGHTRDENNPQEQSGVRNSGVSNRDLIDVVLKFHSHEIHMPKITWLEIGSVAYFT